MSGPGRRCRGEETSASSGLVCEPAWHFFGLHYNCSCHSHVCFSPNAAFLFLLLFVSYYFEWDDVI